MILHKKLINENLINFKNYLIKSMNYNINFKI